MSTVQPPTRATIDDLYKVEGKAELIGGRIVRLMAHGFLPSKVSARIYRSLDDYAGQRGGEANPDGLGFVVPELSSGRESFEPDTSYYDGPLPTNRMRFIEGAPTFAVETRSENDYGPAADQEYVEKRADYFEAGTSVVWDVDPVARTISVYRSGQAAVPAAVYRPGDTAEAEPAVPGWRIAVDAIFAGL
ncbi:MAG: Uma2 family endonuclease [Gemmataceae bacterium]